MKKLKKQLEANENAMNPANIECREEHTERKWHWRKNKKLLH